MEKVSETKKSKRILAFVADEIKRLEGKIMNSPSDIMSEYMINADKREQE